MAELNDHRYGRMTEFYRAGSVPWDLPDPPPEVLELVPTLPVGRALDLGCGYGRASIFMASLDWLVDAVDFIPMALEEAKTRAEQAGVAERIRFLQGAVYELGFLAGPYDFALDVGCAHSLEWSDLEAYHRGLLRLLKSGAVYLIYAHLNRDDGIEDERSWLDEPAFRQIFTDGFRLEQADYGLTTVGGWTDWPSVWLRYKRD